MSSDPGFAPTSGAPRASAASPDGASDGPAPGGPLEVVITGEDWLDAICPFLRARDGSWRSASPARDHRCWATDPPSELPVLTQQRLCLVRPHDGCERFLHARELRSASLARERIPSVDTPPAGIAMAPRSSRGTSAAGDAARESLAWLLRLPRVMLALGAGVVVVVVLVLLLMALGGGGSSGPTASLAVPSTRATDGAIVADPSRGPDGFRRYRVRDGDTLRTIADRFGVSVRQLRLANELGDPPQLQTGEVILIPDPG